MSCEVAPEVSAWMALTVTALPLALVRMSCPLLALALKSPRLAELVLRTSAMYCAASDDVWKPASKSPRNVVTPSTVTVPKSP